jgi:alpha-glucosidase
VNVARQWKDPTSILALHKALIALRRTEPALQLGRLELVKTAPDVLGYMREDRFLIFLNLKSGSQRIDVPRPGAIVLSTHLDRAGERVAGTLALRSDEGLIVRLSHGH